MIKILNINRPAQWSRYPRFVSKYNQSPLSDMFIYWKTYRRQYNI